MALLNTLPGNYSSAPWSLNASGSGFTAHPSDGTRLSMAISTLLGYSDTGTTGYDLTGSSFSWKWERIPFSGTAGGPSSALSIELRDAGTSGTGYRILRSATTGAWTFQKAGVAVGSTWTDVQQRGNPFCRIRESGGTTYFEYSPDGTAWSQPDGTQNTANYTTITNIRVRWQPSAVDGAGVAWVQQTNGAAAPSAITGGPTISLVDQTATAAAAALNTSPALPTGVQSTDLSVLVVAGKLSASVTATATTPPGWTALGSITQDTVPSAATAADTGTSAVAMFYRTGTYTAPTISTTGFNSMATSILVFRSSVVSAGGTWDLTNLTVGSDTSSGANISITGAAGLSVGDGDLVLAAIAASGDVGTPSGWGIAGMSGATLLAGGVETPVNRAVTTGNDCRLTVMLAPVVGGSSSSVPSASYTNASSTTGHAKFLRIRDVAGGTTHNANGSSTVSAGSSASTAVRIVAVQVSDSVTVESSADSSVQRPISSLVDDFGGTATDWVKWPVQSTSRVTQNEALFVEVQGTEYNVAKSGVLSANGSSVFVKTTPSTSAPSHQTFLVVESASDSTDSARISYDGGNLKLEVVTDGVSDASSLTYSATSHAYWRISELAGSFSFATSPDGSAWTTHASKSHAWDSSQVYVTLMAGKWNGADPTFSAQFDNVNVVPSVVVSADGSSTVTVAGSAVASAVFPAAGSNTLAVTGTAGAIRTSGAAGAHTVTASATASASVSTPASGGGTLTVSATSTGTRTAGATTAGTVTALGSATAQVTALTGGGGTLTATGSAAGVRTAGASGSGTVITTGGAAAGAISSTSGVGTLIITSSATGTRTAGAVAAGSVSVVGTAAAATAPSVSASSTLTVSGIASALVTVPGAGGGTLTLTVLGSGTSTARPTSVSTVAVDGTATAQVNAPSGGGGALTVTGTAAGSRTAGILATGAVSVSVTGTANVTGPAGGVGGGTITVSSSASGSRTAGATTAGTVTAYGSSTATSVPSTAATSTTTVSGTSVAASTARPTSVSTVAVDGTATAQVNAPSGGGGALTVTGTGAATVSHPSSGVGTLSVSGTGAGIRTAGASAAGTVSVTGAASVFIPGGSGAISTITVSGSASSTSVGRVGAASSVSTSGSAAAAITRPSSGGGTITATGSAEARTTRTVQAVSTTSVAGVASAVRPLATGGQSVMAVAGSAVATRVIAEQATSLTTVTAAASARLASGGQSGGQISVASTASADLLRGLSADSLVILEAEAVVSASLRSGMLGLVETRADAVAQVSRPVSYGYRAVVYLADDPEAAPTGGRRGATLVGGSRSTVSAHGSRSTVQIGGQR